MHAVLALTIPAVTTAASVAIAHAVVLASVSVREGAPIGAPAIWLLATSVGHALGMWITLSPSDGRTARSLVAGAVGGILAGSFSVYVLTASDVSPVMRGLFATTVAVIGVGAGTAAGYGISGSRRDSRR